MRILAKLLSLPFRILWLAVRGLAWIVASRIFLLIPLALFIIPLTQNHNVPAETFYPLFLGSSALHFIARAIPKRRRKLAAPKLTVPAAPRPIIQPSPASPAPQIIHVHHQPPAVQREQPKPPPAPVMPQAPQFPPFSPVQQLLRPMRPDLSPSLQYAVARLPEAVQRILQR